MKPVRSAGKHATSAKRGKTCNQCKARENMEPVHSRGKEELPSASKNATGAKRNKISNPSKTTEAVPSAGNTTKLSSDFSRCPRPAARVGYFLNGSQGTFGTRTVQVPNQRRVMTIKFSRVIPFRGKSRSKNISIQ